KANKQKQHFLYQRREIIMLHVNQLSKVYEGRVPYRALTDIELDIEEGEFVGSMEPSGRGKTTLLNIIATIDEATNGEVTIEGNHPHKLSKNEVAKLSH